MNKKVLIIDTSILCVWLKVPGKDSCGSGKNTITFKDVNEKIEQEKQRGTTFVLPIASIIETGNHIAHSSGDRWMLGNSFADMISEMADAKSPWAAFTAQNALWQPDKMKELAERWRQTVVSGQSMGDASIVDVATYYDKMGFDVEIYTGDEGLKAHEPQIRPLIPRRKR
ncbi:MAG: hypothetical protein IJ570_06430 [Prevotella sp.]|nr:hypothetical protein [Prevotella sp.]